MLLQCKIRVSSQIDQQRLKETAERRRRRMGIQGLLPLLKSIMVPIHIKDLEGCSVAVDTYSWLHKGALSCSTQLCKGQRTSRHIDYCMHRVNLLRHNGVKPILVFDGGLLPMKGEQENKRARSRKENLERAMEHESNGNSSAAFECYQKAVDISPSIAYELIQVLRQENVYYIVAPYEADAQMAFLAISKQVDAVITEDSDLIPFGCPRIIFKMDKFGQGVEFRNSMLPLNKELSLTGFTQQMILDMCILSGCDYLPSLPGMGLKRAHALIKKFKSYDKVIKHLRYSTVSVPSLYEESFKKAIWTFQHQRVYDPMIEDLAHLSELSDSIDDDLDFLGPSMPQHIAKGIAEGDLDPITKLPFQDGSNNAQLEPDRTYKLKTFKPESDKKKLDLPAQKNLLTNYFCFASLEAKRKFKAPRTTPKNSKPLDGSSPCSAVHVIEEAAINCSPASPIDPGNLGIIHPKDFVKCGLSLEAPEISELPNHEGSNDVKDVVVGDTKIRAQALLQQSSHSIHKPCILLHKERKSSYVLEAVEGKTRVENRKVIVRSSYFQRSVVNENACNNENESISVKDDVAIDTCENPIPESASFGENYSKCTLAKRKRAPTDNFQPGNLNLDFRQENASPPHRNNCPSSLDDTSVVKNFKEEKFGCNISHLDQYSEISEKSMEKFVSVISSYKCSSSGSRASGLRAPLKDVQNTCTNRSNVGVDLSEFAYVPNKRRTASATHRA